MEDPTLERRNGSSGQRVLGWSASMLVLFMPIHVVFVRAGIAIKPWFIPLAVGAVALVFVPEDVRLVAKRAGWWVGGALLALLASALLGLVVAADRAVAARHAGGVVLVVLVVGVVATASRIPYLGLVLRIGAIVMAGAAIVQALLLYSGSVAVAALTWNSAFAEQGAEVTSAGVLVVNGTQVDANFSALYAVTWLFLIMAYRAEAWFGAIGDGVIVALLLGQIVVSSSRGGWLALLAGAAVVGIGMLVGRSGASRRQGPVLVTVAITFTVIMVVLLVADTGDDDADLATNYDIRYHQVASELDRFGGLVTILLPDATADELAFVEEGSEDRSQIWLTYGRGFRENPMTGVGYGVSAIEYSYAHNAPLEAAAGGGFLGLAAWTALLIGVVGLTVRNWRTDRRSLPLAAAVVAVLVASMVLTTNYEPILGLVVGITVTAHLALERRLPWHANPRL